MGVKRILFLTGTRADYGKMKPLMRALEKDKDFELFVFVCGMHLSEKFGNTYMEVLKDGYRNVYIAYGAGQTQSSSVNLGGTISCLSGYVEGIKPDMVVVHGDRMDALAGAVVGALHNIFVAHIEGGELSGTIDESIRHAISKFAHIHFVCNREAKSRLIQLGEEEGRIFVIGSPDIDIMMSESLPSLEAVCRKYELDFSRYGILMYHPVTTEYGEIGQKIRAVVAAAGDRHRNYIVIYPNNDLGSEVILNEYKRFAGNGRFRVYPSLRFECFLTLLKNADFIMGNSSAGVRESGVYGIPALDIGTRQNGRYSLQKAANVQHVTEDYEEILAALDRTDRYRIPALLYGRGDSTALFMEIVRKPEFWNTEIQKHFVDYEMY